MTIPEGGKGERSEEELFRQLVGDAVQKEGEMLWDENLMLQEDPEAEVPADADQRIRARSTGPLFKAPETGAPRRGLPAPGVHCVCFGDFGSQPPGEGLGLALGRPGV